MPRSSCATYHVSSDWSHVSCLPLPDYGAAFNKAGSATMRHHPVFSEYTPWLGTWPSTPLGVDFLGFRFEFKSYCNWAYMIQSAAYAIRAGLCSMLARRVQPGDQVQMSWPLISEEYFEYIDIMTAVLEFANAQRRRPFVLVELGAGYGHWSFTALAALRQKAPRAQYQMVLVDVLDTLEPVVARLATANNARGGSIHFHAGAVTDSGNLSRAQQKNAQRNARTYAGVWKAARSNVSVTALTLDELLAQYSLPHCIDLLDVDIQGGEFGLLSERTVRAITPRVRRVHIGLHSTKREAIDALVRAFGGSGWNKGWHFDKGVGATPFGSVRFADGVMSWQNPNATWCA
mmetsp:Transcript_19699/g.45316  ORF Transcript_19699/g.45316 Transcript_19699/m.45316 type:complete len:346 (-) Transcript_19699:580-1617(-)|eukprot:CAMPEP_0119354746 /NCGR_PEP_ID=MMETSP1334-20130426/3731_1 /TAXON_ID=127549 /ORGANISM="Calcidiscus leptoporus, Strain RCC1130" /LENGTH=345 /DNA_ID=CAMNT_0007368403 /DNA_START=124 /DNA_END=1161 /DNA_ORIENTATION=-